MKDYILGVGCLIIGISSCSAGMVFLFLGMDIFFPDVYCN